MDFLGVRLDWSELSTLWWDQFFFPFDDPGSRFFHLSALSSLVLAVLWWCGSGSKKITGFSTQGVISGFTRVFLRKKFWWNRSTRQDLYLYALNSLLKVFLWIPVLGGATTLSVHGSSLLFRYFPMQQPFSLDPPTLVLFTLLAFGWDDLLRFGFHVAQHRIPWLWRFHRVHHSARIMTPLTVFRSHPVDVLLAQLRNIVSLGIVTAVFVYLFEMKVTLWTVMGVSGFQFISQVLGSNLRHSHIGLEFPPWMERWLISPRQHQLHHSLDPSDFDANFGETFAVWDHLAGSLRTSDAARGRRLSFGLRDLRSHNLIRLLGAP